jgi:hypothetical protein
MKQMPSGWVDTGGGSTAGMEHSGLITAGAAALLLAAALGFAAIRRRASTTDTDEH